MRRDILPACIALAPFGLFPLGVHFLAPGPFPLLDSASKISVYSLSPAVARIVRREESADGREKWEALPQFHGYPVVGKVGLTEGPELDRLRKAINRAIRSGGEVGATLLKPRHGVRIELGGECLDLLICSEGQQIYAFDRSGQRVVPTGVGPESVFDEILRFRGVGVPPN